VLAFGPPEWALLAFAAGQAAYGLATLVSFLHVYAGSGRYMMKKGVVEVHGRYAACIRCLMHDAELSIFSKQDVYFDPDLLHLSGAMAGQSV